MYPEATFLNYVITQKLASEAKKDLKLEEPRAVQV
jgi:hypothetical protein